MPNMLIGPIEVKRLYSMNQLIRMNSGQAFGATKAIKNKAKKLWEIYEKEDWLEFPYTFHLFLYLPETNQIPDNDCSSWVAKCILDGAKGVCIPDDNTGYIANTVLHTPEHEAIPTPQYWASFTEDIFK